MASLDSLYDKSTIKIVAKLDGMSDTITNAVKENAAATAGITESIDSLTTAVKELTEVITKVYKIKKD